MVKLNLKAFAQCAEKIAAPAVREWQDMYRQPQHAVQRGSQDQGRSPSTAAPG
jgi:hypothetical protein